MADATDPAPTGDPDLDLLARWRGGDQVAGQALFARHFTSLYRFFANKCDADADELVQATLVACLRAKDQFRGDASFRTYLFTVARHELYGYLRKRRRDAERLDFSTTSIADLATTPGTKLDRDHDQRRMLDALRALPVEQQTLLELYYWEELEIAQLAEILESPPATIRTWLFRARNALREQMQEAAGGSLDALDQLARGAGNPAK